MSEVTRRDLMGMAALAAGGLASSSASAAAKKPANPQGARTALLADFTGDGIPISPTQYAELLGRLAASPGITKDEYSLGGAVEALEAQFAALLGKETAVFMPSGTLANHLAVRRLAGARRRVVVQEVSHLYNDSGDCAEELSGLNLIPLAPGKATFSWDDVDRVLARTASGRVATGVGAIAIESPVRRLHGETFDFGEMQRVSQEARKRGIALHLDGARLFVACAYSGRSPQEYATLFDTVYVSLWKCFNAAAGAVLAGPKSALGDLFQTRRMFGGALWGAWPDAAVASHYATGYLARLTAAVRVADELLGLLAREERLGVEPVPNGTSLFRLTPRGKDPAAYRERLAARGITIGPPEGDGFWLKVNETLAGMSAPALAAGFVAALA